MRHYPTLVMLSIGLSGSLTNRVKGTCIRWITLFQSSCRKLQKAPFHQLLTTRLNERRCSSELRWDNPWQVYAHVA